MEQTNWLEVSLTVDGELAEAVAEVLARFAPNGVVIETGVKAWTPNGEGITEGTTRVYGYLLIDNQLEETRQRLEEALWFLGRICPLPDAQFRIIQNTDWAETWKQNYRPITIGQKLVVVPAWLKSPNPERIPIKIDPGMAFGTGTHPTTQLCLEMIEECFLDKPSPSTLLPFFGERSVVLDIGCGSGILSIAALKLGAERALGVDTDEMALKAARENAETNGVSERLELGLGSVAEIRGGMFSTQKALLVVANILAPVIISLLDNGLSELIEPDGRLLLSGILEEQVKDVEGAINKHSLQVIERQQRGDWIALAVSS
jgi:ribosomal protein L11 methyltransferase